MYCNIEFLEEHIKFSTTLGQDELKTLHFLTHEFCFKPYLFNININNKKYVCSVSSKSKNLFPLSVETFTTFLRQNRKIETYRKSWTGNSADILGETTPYVEIQREETYEIVIDAFVKRAQFSYDAYLFIEPSQDTHNPMIKMHSAQWSKIENPDCHSEDNFGSSKIFKITLGETTFYCQIDILEFHSSYFKTLFKNKSTKEMQNKELILPDYVNVGALRSVLKYMYLNCMPSEKEFNENFEPLVYLAEYFDLKDFKNQLDLCSISTLVKDPESAWSLSKIAARYRLPILKKCSIDVLYNQKSKRLELYKILEKQIEESNETEPEEDADDCEQNRKKRRIQE